MHSHDEALAVRGDRLEECLGRRPEIALEDDLAGGIEDAHVHRVRVEVDAAVKAVLARVESHRVSPSARKARLFLTCAETTHGESGAGGGPNEDHGIGAVRPPPRGMPGSPAAGRPVGWATRRAAVGRFR